MAITNYTELQAAVTSWMDRPEFTASQVQEMIALAEARLNRLLDVVETEASLTGTANSRIVSISALSMVEPIALKFTENGYEWDITPKPLGVVEYSDTTGKPSFYEINGTNLVFNRPLDQPYPLRFVYQGRFALSDATPTNKLLTDQPDVYLAASIMWGGIFVQGPMVGEMKGLLDEFILETRHQQAQTKRTTLTPDPMIGSLGRPYVSGYGWTG